MIKKIPITLFLFASAACNTKTSISTQAHIFERKVLDNGKLMVYCVYKLGNNLINDSIMVENKVLPLDSVTVQFSYNNSSDKRISIQ